MKPVQMWKILVALALLVHRSNPFALEGIRRFGASESRAPTTSRRGHATRASTLNPADPPDERDGDVRPSSSSVTIDPSISGSSETTLKSSIASAASTGSIPGTRVGDGRKRNVAVLICPAQFCVPSDYDALVHELTTTYGDTVVAATVAPLPRTEWVKVARQLPTQEFVQANLSVFETLKWYFDAIDSGVSELLVQAASKSDSRTAGQPLTLCIVGHSIGGWVARSYLGGMSRSSTAAHSWALQSCSSLITLGTPHASSPPNGGAAWVDQTRGLLRQIDETDSCRASALMERGIDVTCVCSDSLQAGLSNPEEMVALASYLPLLGRFDSDARGDGIVPLDLAFLQEPARRVVVQRCLETSNAVRHSHVLPTPWNLWDGYAPSIPLPDDFCSYTSPGVLSQWAQYIR